MDVRTAKRIALTRAIEDLRMIERESLVEDVGDAGFGDGCADHPDVTKVSDQFDLLVRSLERRLLRLSD